MSYKERAMPCSRTKSRPDNAYPHKQGEKTAAPGAVFSPCFFILIVIYVAQCL